jgi:hypothetical protein
MAGVGPDGPVSLASLQRHIDRVGGRATAMSGAAVSERAKLIREVLLAERAKLLEERRIRERYETSKRRRHQLELLVTLACLALMLYGLAVRVF